MIIEKELNSIVNNFNFFTAIEVANVLNKIGKEIITADKVSSGLKRYLNDKHLSFNKQNFIYSRNELIKTIFYNSFNDYIIHELINNYSEKLSALRDILRLNKKSKENLSIKILNAQKERLESFEKLIENIIKCKISLSFIKEISQQEIYSEIITNENIKNDIDLKTQRSLNKNINVEESLLEYEVLCKKVWDDGIITKGEEIELTNKIKELNLDSKLGNEVFEKIKGEYFAKQDELKKPTSYTVTRVNNNKFIIKKAKLPFHPLFSHEFNRVTGDDIIKINTSHDLYKIDSEEIIINFASSLYYTKLSMTDPNISRFIDRINNNLELIEHE
jgi:ubiquinone/menaquinone biosynthesis C-methylase UbiE